MKHSSDHKSKVILTATERVTPGVPAKAINYALMEENAELRQRIVECELEIRWWKQENIRILRENLSRR
jgi:hypothetical protein